MLSRYLTYCCGMARDFVIGFNRSGAAAQGAAGDISAYYQICHLNGLQCGSPALITQSAVSVADTVYFVGVDKSLDLRFVSFTLGDMNFHNDGTVATGIYRGVISTNGASELAVVYADNSSIYYRSLSLPVGNWSSERLLLTSPSPLPMHPPQSSPYLNCDPLMIPYLSLNNRLPVVWLFGNNPFVLMFSVASLPT